MIRLWFMEWWQAHRFEYGLEALVAGCIILSALVLWAVNRKPLDRHKHVGDPMRLCNGCIPQIASEVRAKKILMHCLLGFALAFAAVMAFVLFRIGVMGR